MEVLNKNNKYRILDMYILITYSCRLQRSFPYNIVPNRLSNHSYKNKMKQLKIKKLSVNDCRVATLSKFYQSELSVILNLRFKELDNLIHLFTWSNLPVCLPYCGQLKQTVINVFFISYFVCLYKVTGFPCVYLSVCLSVTKNFAKHRTDKS